MKTAFFASLATAFIFSSAMADGIQDENTSETQEKTITEKITITKEAESSEEEPQFSPDSVNGTNSTAVTTVTTQTEKSGGIVKKNPNPAYKKSQLIPALIVTSNYAVPRALCELAAKHTNTPYLILPAEAEEPDGEMPIILVSSKGKKMLEFKEKDLSVFLAYMRPADVIILGDADFIPDFYLKAVPKTCNRVDVRDKYWKVNALKLANHLGSMNIYNEFVMPAPADASNGGDAAGDEQTK